jgi:nucleoside-diphosphate-sugar epimerase
MGSVLLTGATGFLGSYVAREAIARGIKPIAMARESSDVSVIDGLHLPIVKADLTEPASLLEATAGIETVIHLAAYYTFHGKVELYDKITVEGTRHLLEACVKNGVKRVIYCSSTEAIGPVANPPGDEDSPPNPQYEYGRSKLKAEEIVKE